LSAGFLIHLDTFTRCFLFPFVLFSKTSAPWRAWLSICLACNASDCRGTACDAARQRTRHDETRDRFSSLSQIFSIFLKFIFHHSPSPVSCSLLFNSSKLRHRATGRSSASPIPGRVWKFVGALAWSGALADHQIVSSNVNWMPVRKKP
jgi:hypothetical protein